MQKNNLLKIDYEEIILNTLFKKEIINEDLYLKCSKPHIDSLPNDYRTNDSEKYQERYDELNKRIDEIEDEFGRYDTLYESDNAKVHRMNFLEKRFKKLDKRIFKECKDYVNELKPLLAEADKIWDESGIEYKYGVSTNYGELGDLNPYEEFVLFCDQFKSKNAGKGNQITGSGFYSYNPDNFSFERGNSYLNYVLSRIESNAKFVMHGESIYGSFSKEEMGALPTVKVNNILNKINDLRIDYDYECRKACDDYNMKRMRKSNEKRDYLYERDRLERYCRQNNIPLEIDEKRRVI